MYYLIKSIITYLIFIFITPYCLYYKLSIYTQYLFLLDKIKKIRWSYYEGESLRELPYDMQRLIISQLPINDYLIKFAIYNYARTETTITKQKLDRINNKFITFADRHSVRIYNYIDNIYYPVKYNKIIMFKNFIADYYNDKLEMIINDNSEKILKILKIILENEKFFLKIDISYLENYLIIKNIYYITKIYNITGCIINITSNNVVMTDDEEYIVFSDRNNIYNVMKLETQEIIFSEVSDNFIYDKDNIIIYDKKQLIFYKKFKKIITYNYDNLHHFKIDEKYFCCVTNKDILLIFSLETHQLINQKIMNCSNLSHIKFYPKYNFYLIIMDTDGSYIFYFYNLETHELIYCYETKLKIVIYKIEHDFIHFFFKDIYMNINIEKAYHIIKQINSLNYEEYDLFNAITYAIKNKSRIILTQSQTELFNKISLEYQELTELVKLYVKKID